MVILWDSPPESFEPSQVSNVNGQELTIDYVWLPHSKLEKVFKMWYYNL